MKHVTNVLGLEEPHFNFRPLLQNHHTYGALRVDKLVTKEFRYKDIDNLYIIPPTSYVDLDDDANVVLKSRVLAQYAMDDIVRRIEND